MSSIYKNGNKWYYQNSINIDGRKQRFQRSLGTDDKYVAMKLQMHYNYVIEYERRNPFIAKREYLSQLITHYLEYREKLVKRRLIAPRTLDSDKGALLNFQRYIKYRFGDIKIKRLHRKDFEDYKDFRLDKDGIAISTLGINLRHLKSFFSYLVKQDILEKIKGLEQKVSELGDFNSQYIDKERLQFELRNLHTLIKSENDINLKEVENRINLIETKILIEVENLKKKQYK